MDWMSCMLLKKVLKPMSSNANHHVKHTTTNTIKCTLSQPINKNTTGIHTQSLCISMYVAWTQTWSCKYFNTTLTNSISLGSNSQNTKLKKQTNKKSSCFSFLQWLHLAQWGPTQFEGRMVAVCSLQFWKCPHLKPTACLFSELV